MKIGIFTKIEENIQAITYEKFAKEIELFNKLLTVHENFVLATSGKVIKPYYPNFTILILLAQTVPLLNNGIDLLCKGYLRSTEFMIRAVTEAVILSAFFKEFPEKEVEYRTLNHRDFNDRYKMRTMLNMVENNGKKFILDKNEAKKIHWNKVVYKTMYKEACRFLHNDFNLLYDLTKNNYMEKQEDLIIGPQPYTNKDISISIGRLFSTLLFSLVTLGISLNISADDEEMKIIELSRDTVHALNSTPK